MTIHYPTGSPSETSSFRFQTEPPHQIRPSFAAGCCIFWRAQTQKLCILHPLFASSKRDFKFHSQMQSTYGCPASAGLYFEKSLKQDRIQFYKSAAWPARAKDMIRFYPGFQHQHLADSKPPNVYSFPAKKEKEADIGTLPEQNFSGFGFSNMPPRYNCI